MPKAGFYAVARGYQPGIYSSWSDCQKQINGYSRAAYKKFNTQREAEEYVRTNGGTGGSSAPTSANTSPAQRKGDTSAAATGPTIPVHLASAGPDSKPTLVPAPPHGKKKPKAESKSKSSKSPWPDVPRDQEHRWSIVYTDGACSNNGKGTAAAGVGVWYGTNDPRNLCERCPGAQTNNRAELLGIIRALETAPHTDKPLLIKTDSAYCMRCVYEWLPKWIKRGKFVTSTGGDVKNLELIQYMASLMALRDLRFRGNGVRLQHVAGHSNLPGNDGADALACNARWLPRNALSEDTWVRRREAVEGEINSILSGGAQRVAEVKPEPAAKTELDDADALPSDEEVNADGPADEFSEDYGAWMDDVPEDDLAAFDPGVKVEKAE